MSVSVSNPRDLLLQLLGQQLYIERRLAGGVIRELADAVVDDGLKQLLEEHLEETRAHVDRLETAFRRIEAAPSANRSAAFEAAVQQHDEAAQEIGPPQLADALHAQTALHTEHDEIAAYTAILLLAPDDVADAVRDSLREEEHARDALQDVLRRLR